MLAAPLRLPAHATVMGFDFGEKRNPILNEEVNAESTQETVST